MAPKSPMTHTVYAVVPKGIDSEVHVRTAQLDGIEYAELREWIPSLKEYGRGMWFPSDKSSIDQVIAGLNAIKKANK